MADCACQKHMYELKYDLTKSSSKQLDRLLPEWLLQTRQLCTSLVTHDALRYDGRGAAGVVGWR